MTAPYGSRTWGDSYQQAEEESVEEAQKSEVEHVTTMTGESSATMDPTLKPSLNRVV